MRSGNASHNGVLISIFVLSTDPELKNTLINAAAACKPRPSISFFTNYEELVQSRRERVILLIDWDCIKSNYEEITQTIRVNFPRGYIVALVAERPEDPVLECLRKSIVDDLLHKSDLHLYVLPLVERAARVIQLLLEQERVRKEAEIRRENMIRIIKHSPDGIFVVDRDMRILAFNSAATRIFGIPATELIGKKFPIDIKDPKQLRQPVELPYVKPDGTEVWLEVSGSEIVWQNAPAFFVHMRDMTLQKMALEEIRSLYIFQESFHKIANVALTVKDLETFTKKALRILIDTGQLNGITVIYQESAERYKLHHFEKTTREYEDHYLTREELPPCTAALNGDDATRLIEPSICENCHFFKKCTRSGTTIMSPLHYDSEYKGWIIICLKGAITELYLEQLKELVDNMNLWLSVVTARVESLIAQQKEKELKKRLQESEEKFRKAFEDSPLWICICNLHTGQLIEINNSALKSLGYSKEELINRTLHDLNICGSREERQNIVQQLCRTGSIKSYEIRCKGKDGIYHDVLLWVELIEVGGQKCALIIGDDITDKKRLEAALLQAQKMEAMGQLVGGIAHDFNNALSVMMGYAEMMRIQLMDKVQKDQLASCVEEIINVIKRTREMTGKLLAFARKQPINPRVLDVKEGVEKSIKLLRQLVGDDIQVEFSAQDGIKPVVLLDPASLDQILMNLAVNARDAIRGRGKITIEIKNMLILEEEAELNPELEVGEYVCIIFSDDGEGMDEETMKHIFEPFFSTKGAKGTGLGLSTVYGIVKQHRGFITVRSEKGKGTTFNVCFPVFAGKAEGITEKSKDELAGGSERIVIVEDDEQLLRMCEQFLSRLGYEVIGFNHPERALLYFKNTSRTADLIITDVFMKGLDGPLLVEEINKIVPNLKAIFITGYPGDVLKKYTLDDRQNVVLQKPFDLKELAETVRNVLEGNRS